MRPALLLVFVGCNQIYGLDETKIRPSDVDSDHDGFTDDIDNCIEIPNTPQADGDGDGIGDVCDNCPLASNVDQGEVGDADGIGDACDPHPSRPGDCLVLVDTFDSPDFDAHWRILRDAGDTASRVDADAQAGIVTLSPRDLVSRIGLAPLRDDGTPILGMFDVQAFGHAKLLAVATEVVVASNAVDTRSGYSCALGFDDPLAYAAICVRPMPGSAPSCNYVTTTTVPVGDLFLIRLNSIDVALVPNGCRIDHGYAVTAARSASVTTVTGGGPAVIAQGLRVRLDGFAIYQFTPGATCADPIFR